MTKFKPAAIRLTDLSLMKQQSVDNDCFATQFVSRHMPGRGAPQVPQPPEVASKDSEPPAGTANAENSFSTRELLHFSQSIEVVFNETIFSNVAPQSEQRYS